MLHCDKPRSATSIVRRDKVTELVMASLGDDVQGRNTTS